MRTATTLVAVVLASLSGCAGNEEREEQLQAALERITSMEETLQKTNERISSLGISLRQLEKEVKQSESSIILLPELRKDVDGMAASLSNLESLSDKASKILEIVAREGDRIVARGIIVADETGATRCMLSPTGLSIADEKGRGVCEIQYEAKARAMTASLRAQNSNSVTLYAGDDRAAIGAHGVRHGGLAIEHRNKKAETSTSLKLLKENGEIGWAATVTPEGEVTEVIADNAAQ
jgi:hypothetical protein